MPDVTPLVAWMRERMDERGMSQSDLAREMGKPTGSVYRWLNGERPKPDTIQAIARALGGDVDALLVLAGHREPASSDAAPAVANLVAKIRQAGLAEYQIEELDGTVDVMVRVAKRRRLLDRDGGRPDEARDREGEE